MQKAYSQPEPSRSEIDAMSGPVLLDFGTEWCGFCRAARPMVEAALAHHPGVRHIRVEDGSGRRLGRSFGVKLWPTLIFMKDGREIDALVRPGSAEAVRAALARITA